MSDDYIARITKPEYLRATFGTPDRREVYKMQIKNNDRGLANQRAKLQLPYYAPNHPPLPSRAEIEAAFESSIIPNMLGGYPVCRVGQCMVKFSSDMVIWQEAENLLFINQNTKVQAPRLYAVYESDDAMSESPKGTMMYYMIMEYVDGMTMSRDLFDGMSRREKDMILQGLAEQIQLLRSVEPTVEPDGHRNGRYYGRIYHQGWHPSFKLVTGPELGLQGPYDTYDDFVSAVVKSTLHEGMMAYKEFDESLRRLVANVKSAFGASKDTQPVLTHIDIKWSNIIVQPLDDKGDGEGPASYRVVLIDWDGLGWAPAFLQKLLVYERLNLPYPTKESGEFVGFTKDQYKTEFEWFLTVARYWGLTN